MISGVAQGASHRAGNHLKQMSQHNSSGVNTPSINIDGQKIS